HLADALHVASASVAAIARLASWNYHHLLSKRRGAAFNRVNAMMGDIDRSESSLPQRCTMAKEQERIPPEGWEAAMQEVWQWKGQIPQELQGLSAAETAEYFRRRRH